MRNMAKRAASWSDPSTWLTKRSYDVSGLQPPQPLPDKIFIENDGGAISPVLLPNGVREQTDQAHFLEKFYDRYNELMYGFYGAQNFIQLFHVLPEIFAPIHEIASRVADAEWKLIKTYGTQEVDDTDATFQRLFTQPNPIQSHKALVYNAVCYEILTGKNFFYTNWARWLVDDWSAVVSWSNLPAHAVRIMQYRNVDIYDVATIQEIIQSYRVPVTGQNGWRQYMPEDVWPILHGNLMRPHDLNFATSLIAGADKAIRNLIPVYEARGIIYIKRGALGLFVNAAKDANGPMWLTDEAKLQMAKNNNDNYGLGADKQPFKYVDADLRFERVAMSIQELQPFEETIADAVAIYSTLRVPRTLMPTKDAPKYDNGGNDMKRFYIDVIIPWAQRYAQIWTTGFNLAAQRRKIQPCYEHIDYLQEDKGEAADAAKQEGSTWLERWQHGACTLNEWIVSFEGTKGVGPFYEKKLFEMTPPEQQLALQVIQGMPKQQQQQNNNGKNTNAGSTNTTAQSK